MGLDLPPRLTRREAQAILVGLAALEPNLDEDLRRRIPRTALAVKALVGEEADPPLLVHSDSPGLDLLDDLADAISKGEAVSFTYTDARGARCKAGRRTLGGSFRRRSLDAPRLVPHGRG